MESRQSPPPLMESWGSELFFASLVETAPDGVIVVAADRIVYVNGQAESLFGYGRDELRGQPIEALIPERHRGAHPGHRGSYAQDPHPRPMRVGRPLAGLRKDGSEFPAEISLCSMQTASGAVVAAFVRDLTDRLRERQRADEALQRTQEQLRQSQKMDAIGRLAGGIAHDFNNLLTVVLSQCAIILSDLPQGDPLRGDVGEIQAAGERASSLTRHLLAFSRQQVISPEVTNLNDVIIGMERMLQRIVGEDLELKTILEPTLGMAKLDWGQTEQVILNLVVNARDALPTGGKVTIETANVLLDEAYASAHVGVTPGPHVMIAVSDTGTGMDEATKARAFEPFFTTKARGKGTGLGLSTVFGIVKQSGGSIYLYSEVGVGTTFRSYFPQCLENPTRAKVSDPLAQSNLRGTETILVVEDETPVRTLVRTILMRHGYTVLEASNPGEAILLSESYKGVIHMLLTDVVMPQSSGRVLAERLAPLRPGMKVVYMSGYTDNAIVHHGILDRGVHFLQKPLTPNVLTRKIREVLNG